MDDAPDNPDIQPSQQEQQRKLTVDGLSDDQLRMLAETWESVRDSDTPMADLRSALTDGGLFEFSSLYNTNNIELRSMGVAARDTLTHRQENNRRNELTAIMSAVEGRESYADKRTALSDLLGFSTVHGMTNQDIDNFISDAQAELDGLNAEVDDEAGASSQNPDNPSDGADPDRPNQLMADEVGDLIEGHLTVDAADRVRYTIGATALGRKVGGQFVSPSQLRDIYAFADQIRNGLPVREAELASEPEPAREPSPIDTPPESDPPTGPDRPTPDDPADPDTPPVPIPERDAPLTLTFVDQTHDARAAARDAAEARLRNELQEDIEGNRLSRGFKRFIRTMWKGEHGLARHYYREKYKKEALEQIQQQNDLLANEDVGLDARTRAQMATIDRFQSEYDESIHDEAGEQREKIAKDSPFAIEIKQLIQRYASGEITDADALQEERGRLLQRMQDSGNGQLIGEGAMRIDNLLAIADQVKAMVDHGESIERVLEGMKIYTGESRANVRSEAHLSKIERAIDRMQRSRIGGLVGPVALGAAASVVIGVTNVGRGSLLTAAGMMAVPGAVSGGFAALRESKRVKEERALHSREMAQGKTYEPGSKRRDQMEETRYETRSATVLTQTLNELLKDVETPTPEAVQGAYATVAVIEARIRKSDKSKVDLLSYSDVASIEQERRDLDEARALAKIRLKTHLGSLPEAFRTQFSVHSGQSANQALEQYIGEANKLLETDISQKDAAFAKLRRRRVLTAAAVGAGVGIASSFITQEVVAGLDANRNGLVESWFGAQSNPDGRSTILKGTADWLTGSKPPEATGAFRHFESHAIEGHKGVVQLPEGYKVTAGNDGQFGIEDPEGHHIADGLSVDKAGKLTPASLDTLHNQGIGVEDHSKRATITTEKTKKVSIRDYVKHHKNETTKVTRDFWYDNNTPKPIFEKNELGLAWGGEDGKGVGKHDDIKMSIAGMTQGGSYHNGESVSWEEAAKDGKLKVAISASRDTQTDVFMIKVNPNGGITIPEDHPARKFFTIDKHGQAHFRGGFVEAVEDRGKQGGSKHHISPLATITGEDRLKEVTDVVKVPSTVEVPRFTLIPPIPIENQEYDTLGVPGFVTRRPLERIRKMQTVSPQDIESFGYGYHGGKSLEEMRRWIGVGDRLRSRREEVRDDKKVWVEADGSPVERNVGRERSTLSSYLESQYASSPEYKNYVEGLASAMGPMNDKCRVAVNIPAWLEEKNLPGLLTQYFDQKDKDGNPLDPELYEVNIIINRKEGTPGDASAQVIEKFMADYSAQHGGRRPNVRYVDVEFKPENATVGYARKVLTDAVLARSLARPNQQEPLYIESEDADLLDVDRRVISNLISKLDKNPHLDAVRGTEGRMPEILKENSLLAMRRNAWEVFLMMSRQRRYRNPAVPGWNAFANRIITSGWNTGYSAEAYAMIGGYEPVRAGEDISIGERISMVRGDGSYPNLETIGSVPTRTESSPRRFINEIIKHKGAYEGFGEGPDEQTIRDMSLPDLMSQISDLAVISEKTKPAFHAEAKMFYDWCKSATPTEHDAREMMHRVMHGIGYRRGDYQLSNGEVHVSNWDNVTHNLERYRNEFASAQRPNRKMVLGGWKRPGLRTRVRT